MTKTMHPIEKAWRLSIIQRQIFCPVSGKVLDIRTARFALDSDGDPYMAFDPELADRLEEDIASGRQGLLPGYTLEPKS